MTEFVPFGFLTLKQLFTLGQLGEGIDIRRQRAETSQAKRDQV